MESLRILGSSIIVKNLCALFTSYDFINFHGASDLLRTKHHCDQRDFDLCWEAQYLKTIKYGQSG